MFLQNFLLSGGLRRKAQETFCLGGGDRHLALPPPLTREFSLLLETFPVSSPQIVHKIVGFLKPGIQGEQTL